MYILNFTDESCQYVPYIQSKEYYLSNLVRNTPPEGGTLFVSKEAVKAVINILCNL